MFWFATHDDAPKSSDRSTSTVLGVLEPGVRLVHIKVSLPKVSSSMRVRIRVRIRVRTSMSACPKSQVPNAPHGMHITGKPADGIES